VRVQISSAISVVGHWVVSGIQKLYRNIARIPRDRFVLYKTVQSDMPRIFT